jgi:Uma2 family endonuclease
MALSTLATRGIVMSVAELSVAAPRTYTPEELLTLPENDQYELVDGQLVEKAMGAESDGVAVEIAAVIRDLVRAQRLGRVFGSSTGYRCFPDDPNRIRRPDASFIRQGRLPRDRVPRGYISIAPDLAVEVISPHDLYSEVDQKVREYLDARVELVWVFNPDARTVHVYRADGTSALLTAEHLLDGGNVLPGFRYRVGDLFANALD